MKKFTLLALLSALTFFTTEVSAQALIVTKDNGNKIVLPSSKVSNITTTTSNEAEQLDYYTKDEADAVHAELTQRFYSDLNDLYSLFNNLYNYTENNTYEIKNLRNSLSSYATLDEVNELIKKYMDSVPQNNGLTEDQVKAIIAEFMAKNPGVTEADVANIVVKYCSEMQAKNDANMDYLQAQMKDQMTIMQAMQNQIQDLNAAMAEQRAETQAVQAQMQDQIQVLNAVMTEQQMKIAELQAMVNALSNQVQSLQQNAK